MKAGASKDAACSGQGAGLYTGPMLWVKAFHIVLSPAGFAGLFYLPRILSTSPCAPGSVAERERLLLIDRKLLRFTTMLAVPALGLGLWLWLGWGFGRLAACQAGRGAASYHHSRRAAAEAGG
ncbi:CopD family protein [Staphylococcus epidermidis]|nr:CopD family protein [Staphylococcus epidermidis]